MKIDYFKYSNQGERKVNEDSVGAFGNDSFFAFTLCDGLGGHGGGDVASSTAVKAIINSCDCSLSNEMNISECFEQANQAVEQVRLETGKDMMTTVTLLFINNDVASWAHIGDSRIYYFKKKRLISRSLDHSVPQMLVATGEIKEKDIRHHPDRNRLLRCLPWDNKKYDVDGKDVSLSKGDSFLMMSDGFWDWIDEKEMKKALKKKYTSRQVAERLTELAFEKGRGNNMDNLSLIVVRVN